MPLAIKQQLPLRPFFPGSILSRGVVTGQKLTHAGNDLGDANGTVENERVFNPCDVEHCGASNIPKREQVS